MNTIYGGNKLPPTLIKTYNIFIYKHKNENIKTKSKG